MINIHDGMTFEVLKPDHRKDIYVSLDESVDSDKGYRLVVYLDGVCKTEDFFDSFADAFDSFSNIVKTMLKEI